MGKLIYKGKYISGGNNKANKIEYDNSISRLQSTNVQNAIDELDEKINTEIQNIDIRYNDEIAKPEWKQRGADTWTPFSSGEIEMISTSLIESGTSSITFPQDGVVMLSLKSSMNTGNTIVVKRNGVDYFSLYVGSNRVSASAAYPASQGDVMSFSISGTVNLGGCLIGAYCKK